MKSHLNQILQQIFKVCTIPRLTFSFSHVPRIFLMAIHLILFGSLKMVKFDRFILQEKDFRNASNQKKKDKKFPYKSSYFRKKP